MEEFDPSYRPNWSDDEIEFWTGVFNVHPALVEEHRAGVIAAMGARGLTIMPKEDVEAVREALAEYEAMADHVVGCGDSNCLVYRPIGQHTNGGCRCHYDKRKSQRMMAAGQRLYTAIRSLKSTP